MRQVYDSCFYGSEVRGVTVKRMTDDKGKLQNGTSIEQISESVEACFKQHLFWNLVFEN